jgi:hypothetical protein
MALSQKDIATLAGDDLTMSKSEAEAIWKKMDDNAKEAFNNSLDLFYQKFATETVNNAS